MCISLVLRGLRRSRAVAKLPSAPAAAATTTTIITRPPPSRSNEPGVLQMPSKLPPEICDSLQCPA